MRIRYICWVSASATPLQLESSSVPGDRENDCICSGSSKSAVIAVAAATLLIVILITVILIQCLLMVKMRIPKFKHALHRNGACKKAMTSTSMCTDVPVSPNEVYELNKTTSEEMIYETVMN